MNERFMRRPPSSKYITYYLNNLHLKWFCSYDVHLYRKVHAKQQAE
jgi:hypothetical protein